MALTTLMLELSGPDALLYQFSVEALFLGAPVMHVSGERVVLSGPTGREPLVGLRVSLHEASDPRHQRAAQSAQYPQSKQKLRLAAIAEPTLLHRPLKTAPDALLGSCAGFPQSPERQACHVNHAPRPLAGPVAYSPN